jgi:mRNA-degrading endonuclease toxin of MazEF toxin-antitoxin module
MTHDSLNLRPGWQSIIVVPMSTSASQARRGPTAVEIPGTYLGSTKNGVALCHQVTTIDRSKILKLIGTLPDHEIERVAKGLKVAMDLP